MGVQIIDMSRVRQEGTVNQTYLAATNILQLFRQYAVQGRKRPQDRTWYSYAATLVTVVPA